MSAFLHFVKSDWWIAIPMFLMSLAGVTLVIWRVLLNINGNTKMAEFLPLFQQRLEKEGIESAKNLCKKRLDIIPRKLFLPGLDVSTQGLAAARRAMGNAIELEIVPELNFLLPWILAIAKIATMVGLFGTVISMIGTFNAIANASSGGASGQAGNIGLALFATALGLITAIPLVFAHVLFKAWVHDFEIELRKGALKLVALLQAAKSAPKKESPATMVPGAPASKLPDSKAPDAAAAVRR